MMFWNGDTERAALRLQATRMQAHAAGLDNGSTEQPTPTSSAPVLLLNPGDPALVRAVADGIRATGTHLGPDFYNHLARGALQALTTYAQANR